MGGGLTRDGVEEDEVLKVGYLPSLPALSHVGCFEQLLRCGERDAPAWSTAKQTGIETLGASQVIRKRSSFISAQGLQALLDDVMEMSSK